jgi:hypothetical protein
MIKFWDRLLKSEVDIVRTLINLTLIHEVDFYLGDDSEEE